MFPFTFTLSLGVRDYNNYQLYSLFIRAYLLIEIKNTDTFF